MASGELSIFFFAVHGILDTAHLSVVATPRAAFTREAKMPAINRVLLGPHR